MKNLSIRKSFRQSRFLLPVLLVGLGLFQIGQAEAQTFTALYSFAAPATGSNNFGANPQAGLVLLSNTLYGTTYFGGSILNTNGYTNIAAGNGYGTVYGINTDGTGYTNVINFTYSTNSLVTNFVFTNGVFTNVITATNTTYSQNGEYPISGLLLVANGSNNLLYGTTSLGKSGSSNSNTKSEGDGTIFVINLSFTNNTNSGGTNSGGTNSGGTNSGGTNSGGTNTNTTNFSNFTNIYNFTAAAIGSANKESSAAGGYPIGSLVIATDSVTTNPTNALFGTAYYGGTNGYGTIYVASLDGNKVPYSIITNYTTNRDSNNVITSITAKTNTNSDIAGSIHSFDYTNGALPESGLLVLSNALYGTASVGGDGGNGVIYSIGNDSRYAVLYSFSATDASGHNLDGAIPKSGLILSGTNTLYGTASQGGAYGYGTIFAINTDGTGFTNLYSFSNGVDGAYPYAGLVLSNNTLFGTASQGGSNGTGTVFAINTDGTGFSTLYSFTKISGTNGTNNDGAYPVAGLNLTNGILYGTAALGGTNGAGTVFSIIIPSVYTITLSATPTEGGTVSGNGSFSPGSTNTVTAVENTNYSFISWTQNGTVVSTNDSYTLTLNGNVNLVANFSNNLAFAFVNRGAVNPRQFQTISFPTITSKTYGVAPFSLNATASSGLTPNYTLLSGPATVSSNTVTITGVGTVVLAANQSGSANYYQAKQVDVSFKVNKASQAIILPVNSLAQTVGVKTMPFSLPLTSTSGLKVTVRVKSGPARISGDTITLTGKPGTVVLEATQSGNKNYLPAPSVITRFLVQ